MDEHPTDVDPDRGFRTPQPDPAGTGTDPGRPVPSAGSGGADPDHPGLGEAGDQGDSGDTGDTGPGDGSDAGSGEDQERRAADLKPSKKPGHPGSSSDRPPALDPES
jgi:hypothetical protein